METTKPSFFRQNRPILITAVVLLVLPFLIGLIEGSSPAVIWWLRISRVGYQPVIP